MMELTREKNKLESWMSVKIAGIHDSSLSYFITCFNLSVKRR